MEQAALPAREHRLGVLLVLGSSVFFALAGILTKSATADAFTVACWRGLFGALLISAYVWLRRGARPPSAAFGMGRDVWLVATVGAVASIAFIASFKHTYVANVTVIYATAPFLAALLDRMIRTEPFHRRTMIAAAVSLCGVAVIVAGGFGSLRIAGDALALAMTALSALYIVLIRAHRDAPVVWAGALSGFQLFVLGWLVADPLAVAPGDWFYLAAFGFTFASAVILWTEGARLIPAAEAGLLGAAEIPVAILFAAIFLAEWPPLASFAGGAIVLAAVAWHTLAAANAKRRTA